MNKTLLMIAPYFVPRRRVGAYRPFRFAVHLREFGWEPFVITIGSHGDTLTEKEKKLLEGISVFTLDPPVDTTKESGSHLGSKKRGGVGAVISLFGKWIDRNFPVDTWLPFFMIKWPRIKKIIREIQPDAIWSTGDPWSAHWLGRKVKKEFADVPWVADFRDPWTLTDVNLKKRSALSSMMDRKIEKSIISEASSLTFTSGNTRKKYEEYYGRASLPAYTIYNAFDMELYEPTGKARTEPKVEERYLNIMFYGKFRRLSPAAPLIDILSEVKSRNPSAVKGIRMYSFGPLDENDRAYAREKGVESCFVFSPPVPPEMTLLVLKDADILFLSTDTDRDDIIPAKLWDYLAAQIPILSIAPNPEIETILRETGAGMQFPAENTGEVAELLIACLEAGNKGDDLPIRFEYHHEKVAGYDARNATRRLAEILDQSLR